MRKRERQGERGRRSESSPRKSGPVKEGKGGCRGRRGTEGVKGEGERERIAGSLWEFVIARSSAQRGRSEREEGEGVDFELEQGCAGER